MWKNGTARLTVVLLGLGLGSPSPASAQSLEGGGVVATGLLLRQLDGVKRVLMIGAHPDDEDTSLLTTLARGWGAETAYLALTRGDGGQNLIGSELWEGLGIVRTGELVAARALDGGLQFFTRAFDYGFSKSADEALTFWPREELLEDVVWVIRKYRPQVIVSVFTGTPSDGHGQHQAAGIMAREAFAAAGDETRFPEQLARGVEAWSPDKLYQSSRRRFTGGAAEPGEVEIPTGRRDPLLGRSLLQLSMESRSQHRSQDMGAAQPAGPRSTSVVLVESRAGAGDGLFSGVDTTLAGLASSLPSEAAAETRRHLEAYRASVHAAIDGFGLDPATIAPDLMRAMEHLVAAGQAAGGAGGSSFDRAIAAKRDVLNGAILAAAGVSFEVRADDDLLVPGQTVRVRAQLWNGGAYSLRRPEAGLSAPRNWRVTEVSVEGLAPGGNVAPESLVTWTFDVRLPEDAASSKLYYLRRPRDGAWYQWPDDPGLWALPTDPSAVNGSAEFTLASAGQAVGGRRQAREPWRFVGVNPAAGEFVKPVLIVPALSVAVTPRGAAWPQGRSAAREISVVVRSEAPGGSRGSVSMRAPPGWVAVPDTQLFELGEAGSERAMTFAVRPSPSVTTGRHVFEVVASTADGHEFREGYHLIDYDHIERAVQFEPSTATVSVIPVAVSEGLRVGYVMGSGDDGPEAIRQMGAVVELLDEARVRDGAFGDFGAVVLGVRAYETRADLQAASAQLLDYVRGGGTVVVQYNRGPLGNLAPYPLDVGRNSPRVADETAPVTLVDTRAPVFTRPNQIGPTDFEGWVQERGLYFASEWDDRYVPVLELNDPGEDPARGSTLIASVGEGLFVYTALSFFRQWDDPVPGAYRLFANLISLDAAAWRAFEQGR